MIYFNEDFLEISWNERVECVVMRWKKFVIGDNFRRGLDKGLDLIIEKKSHKWLADLQNMKALAKDDQEWSNNDWYPRAISGGIRKMAIVMPTSTLATMSVRNILSKVGDIDIETAYFDDMASASLWLKE